MTLLSPMMHMVDGLILLCGITWCHSLRKQISFLDSDTVVLPPVLLCTITTISLSVTSASRVLGEAVGGTCPPRTTTCR